jgi:hypothetical protein
MKNISKEVAKALDTLSGSKEFQVFVSFIEDDLRKLQAASATMLDDTLLRWNQGRCQVLQEQLDIIANSRSNLEKLIKAEHR